MIFLQWCRACHEISEKVWFLIILSSFVSLFISRKNTKCQVFHLTLTKLISARNAHRKYRWSSFVFKNYWKWNRVFRLLFLSPWNCLLSTESIFLTARSRVGNDRENICFFINSIFQLLVCDLKHNRFLLRYEYFSLALSLLLILKSGAMLLFYLYFFSLSIFDWMLRGHFENCREAYARISNMWPDASRAIVRKFFTLASKNKMSKIETWVNLSRSSLHIWAHDLDSCSFFLCFTRLRSKIFLVGNKQSITIYQV